ncbi:pectinesterase family protein [Flavobacterium eburneipallidum]|uniref:pectinesterase family protein n=1 Tax=Flavobacterium eburneipallidum TaxID=3003263 RepID=UPI002482D453|nr:pectinesterase family protein [Flavobacterium eburneipallidum]
MKIKTTFSRRWAFVVLNLLFLSLCGQSIAQTVNESATITWPFDSGAAGQIATYSGSASTASYFKPDYITLGASNVYNGKATPNATTVTADPTLSGLTFTKLKAAVASGNTPTGAVPSNLLAFNITNVTGLSFKPTSISFKCLRFGTGSGLIDLYWKSNDGTNTVSTLIQANIKPGRDNAIVAGDNTTSVNIDLASLNLPASTKECTLQVYIHSLGSAKDVGLSKVIVNGTVSGTIQTVVPYDVITSNSPTAGGSVATFPVGTTHDSGTSITLTATRNFGYAFSHWENGSGVQVATANPYTFTLTANTNLKAVYTPINTYALNLTQTAGSDYMVVPTPAGTMVGGQRMYEDGTNVTIKANANSIFSFSNWGTGETTSELTVKMDQARTVNAVYSTIDYVVGWDFYKAGGSGRVADFASKPDNTAASLVMRKADGTASGWLDKSIVAAAGNYGRGSAVNWKLIDELYYYQISFNASDFVNMSVKAGMLYNYVAHTVQKMEYSLDGVNFTTLGTYNLAAAQTWYDQTFTLPADANNKPLVYVRWIPDYTSPRVGSGTTNDGTSLSEIYVFGSQAIVNDGIAPVLTSSVPANAATGASSSGKIVLNFDEKVQILAGTTATLGSKTLTPEVSGKTISFPYAALDYNTNYTFTLAGNKVSDLSGNTMTTPISFGFTTLNKPTVTKKKYDFIVGVDGNFAAAKAAAQAASASGERYFIFFPNGQYDLGNTTGDATQKTVIGIPNVSYIGQSADGVVLFNEPLAANEGIGTTPTINFLSSSTNIYMQDITILNKMDYRKGVFSGRAVALHDQGNKNIYKNVKLLSNQDTFYTGGNRIYLENSEIHGTVDFIFGGGDVFFNECTIYLENRSGNVITAASTTTNWGYVFNNCTIDGFDINNGGYSLGRPWQNSPKVAFLNTTMKKLSKADGWSEWGALPSVYAEYNTMTSTGSLVDLSNRKTNYSNGSGGSVVLNPKLTPTQAANYTLDNVLNGVDAWQPKLYTDQITAPVIAKNATSLTWADNNYVLGWAVMKDDVFVDFVTTNSYTIPNGTSTGKYTVRAANSMGGLGLASNEINLATLGVNENKMLDVKVYPNPVVNNQFFVSVPTTVENATMELFGLDGKQLLKKEVKNTIEEVNVSGMTSGVYVLKINSNSGSQVVKIVK